MLIEFAFSNPVDAHVFKAMFISIDGEVEITQEFDNNIGKVKFRLPPGTYYRISKENSGTYLMLSSGYDRFNLEKRVPDSCILILVIP